MKKLLVALILVLLAGAGTYAYFKYGKPEDKGHTATPEEKQEGKPDQKDRRTPRGASQS